MICEKGFKDPIVTICKHYFCEKCALQNYVNDQNCFVCGVQTKGSFNTATKIEAKLKKQAKVVLENKTEDTIEDEDAKVIDKFAK
jgi:RING finger protein 113A